MNIGIGIITCNREEFFWKCLNSIDPSIAKALVVVNDGRPLSKAPPCELIQHEKNMGVCLAKNDALRYLLEKDSQHIFLIEDDIIVKNMGVFAEYIRASNITGLQHLMFAYSHLESENCLNGKPSPLFIVKYAGVKISCNFHIYGAFVYYSRKCLDKVGLMDERFNHNAWEHVEHTHRIIKAGMCSPFWAFPDIVNSTDYLETQATLKEHSSINSNKVKEFDTLDQTLYKELHGTYIGQIPGTRPEDTLKLLAKIKKEHSNVEL